MLRGIFGSAARAAIPAAMADMEGLAPSAPGPAPVPAGIEAAPMPITSARMDRALPAEANMERSYLGGLIKYQRPDGQTPQERMALIGATLGDIGSSLGGGGGGNLARVQEQYRAQQKRDQAGDLLRKLYPDDPEAQALADIDPGALSRAWLEKKKPVDWEHVEADDGLYLINPRTRETHKVAAWDRKGESPLEREYRQAQIDAVRALAGQRENQGAYYGVKAKHPYAPPRARAGGGASSSGLPPGYQPVR